VCEIHERDQLSALKQVLFRLMNTNIFSYETIDIVIIKYVVTTDIFQPLMWPSSWWQLAVFSILPPWTRPHFGPKHVAGHYIVN